VVGDIFYVVFLLDMVHVWPQLLNTYSIFMINYFEIIIIML